MHVPNRTHSGTPRQDPDRASIHHSCIDYFGNRHDFSQVILQVSAPEIGSMAEGRNWTHWNNQVTTEAFWPLCPQT